jgi:hypothetical protein
VACEERIRASMSCPACNRKIDEATAIQEDRAKPMVGDISVCLYCGTLLRFITVDPLRCRIMTDLDLKDISPESYAKLKFIQARILGDISK